MTASRSNIATAPKKMTGSYRALFLVMTQLGNPREISLLKKKTSKHFSRNQKGAPMTIGKLKKGPGNRVVPEFLY